MHLIDKKSEATTAIHFHSHVLALSSDHINPIAPALVHIFFTMKYSTISTDQLQPWAILNDVELCGVKISPAIFTEDGVNKGGGLLSTTAHESQDVLLSISRDLTLSKETVSQCAKTDKHLRDLTEALSEFIQVG